MKEMVSKYGLLLEYRDMLHKQNFKLRNILELNFELFFYIIEYLWGGTLKELHKFEGTSIISNVCLLKQIKVSLEI